MSPLRRFTTTTVALGPCSCPDTPHADGDSAEVVDVLGWDDLYGVTVAGGRHGDAASALTLVTRAIRSWTYTERGPDGKVRPVPVTEANVHRLDDPTSDLIWPLAWAAYEAAQAPLPNAPGEGSPPSQPATDSSTPTTLTT